jgi:hypothetical protein
VKACVLGAVDSAIVSPVIFVAPTGRVTQRFATKHQVDIAHVGARLAVVERLQLGQYVGVLFDQVGEFPHYSSAVAPGRAAPGTFERLTSGGDRLVYVGSIAFGDLSDHSPGARIEGVERLSGDRIRPLAADERLVFAGEEFRYGLADLRMGSGLFITFLQTVYCNRS